MEHPSDAEESARLFSLVQCACNPGALEALEDALEDVRSAESLEPLLHFVHTGWPVLLSAFSRHALRALEFAGATPDTTDSSKATGSQNGALTEADDEDLAERRIAQTIGLHVPLVPQLLTLGDLRSGASRIHPEVAEAPDAEGLEALLLGQLPALSLQILLGLSAGEYSLAGEWDLLAYLLDDERRHALQWTPFELGPRSSLLRGSFPLKLADEPVETPFGPVGYLPPEWVETGAEDLTTVNVGTLFDEMVAQDLAEADVYRDPRQIAWTPERWRDELQERFDGWRDFLEATVSAECGLLVLPGLDGTVFWS